MHLLIPAMALVLVLPAVAPQAANEASASKRVPRSPNLRDLRDLPEGGIIHLVFARISELDTLKALGMDMGAFPVAYLMSHTADPEKFPYRIGECATQADGVSPFSQSRQRDYFPAGALTFKGGPKDLVLRPKRNVHDREGRDHDVAYHENILPGGQFLTPGSEYEIHLAGSNEFPETTYEKGAAIYLPPEHKEIKPGYPVEGAIEIPRGRDFIWKWDPADKPKQPGLRHYHWIGFEKAPENATGAVDRTGISMAGLTHWCLHEDTGEYIISKETIDELRPEGFVVYGAGALRFGELKGGAIEGRRLEFGGFFLYVARYRVVESRTTLNGFDQLSTRGGSVHGLDTEGG